VYVQQNLSQAGKPQIVWGKEIVSTKQKEEERIGEGGAYYSSVGACPAVLIVGHDGKLVDNFIHESDVTSLQDLFTSRP